MYYDPTKGIFGNIEESLKQNQNRKNEIYNEENTRISDVNTINSGLSIAFVTLSENGDIDEVTAGEHMDMFGYWEIGINYSSGNIRKYEDKLYKCLQAHTSQSDWTPDVSPSLWKCISDPMVEFPEWSQPIGAMDAYQIGDKVSYNDKHWVSTTANNVWAPGVYGWDEVI